MDKKKYALIGIMLLVLIIIGYFVSVHYFNQSTMVVEASGTIEATTVDLTAKVPGTIQKIYYKAGDQVEQGELAAEIIRNDLVAQKERDSLNVLIAQNKLDDLLSGARAQEIREAKATVNIMQAGYDKAKKDLERAQALTEEGSLAQSDLEIYQKNSLIAQNQLEAAQAKLNLLQSGNREEQIKAAENQVKVMEAVLKATEAVIADLKVITPLGGTIQNVNYETGEYVPAGAKIGSIANLDKVWINVYVPTDDLPFVNIGDQVQFTVSGIDQNFNGTVTEIATHGEFTPKTIQTKKERANIVYKVKIEVDNSQGYLKPGMPADVIIKKQPKEDSAEGKS